MNQKTLSIIIVLAVLLGGTWLVLNQADSSKSTPGTATPEGKIGEKLYPEFPINDITGIRIASVEGETLLKRDEIWRVASLYGYPANFDSVSGLLRRVWELEPVQAVRVGPSQFGRLSLLAPSAEGADATQKGTLVEFTNAEGKSVETLLLGETHQSNDSQPGPMGMSMGGSANGRYILASPTSEQPWLVDEPFNIAQADPTRWLNQDFLSVQEPKIIEVETEGPENINWKVTRETAGDDFTFAEGLLPEGREENPDTLRPLQNVLGSASFSNVLPIDSEGDDELFENATVATIETFGGFTYKFSLGQPNEDGNLPLKVSIDLDVAEERPKGDDEPEDEAKQQELDQQYAVERTEKQEKLAEEKAYEQWVFYVPSWSVSALRKPLEDYLQDPPAEEEESSEDGADASIPDVMSEADVSPTQSAEPEQAADQPSLEEEEEEETSEEISVDSELSTDEEIVMPSEAEPEADSEAIDATSPGS